MLLIGQALKERGISIHEVKQTILHPNWYEPSFRKRVKVRKKMREKTIEVVYSEEALKYTVITAYVI